MRALLTTLNATTYDATDQNVFDCVDLDRNVRLIDLRIEHRSTSAGSSRD